MYVDRRRESTLAAEAFGTLQSMLISFHLISRGGSCGLVGWYINCSYSVLHQRFLNVYTTNAPSASSNGVHIILTLNCLALSVFAVYGDGETRPLVAGSNWSGAWSDSSSSERSWRKGGRARNEAGRVESFTHHVNDCVMRSGGSSSRADLHIHIQPKSHKYSQYIANNARSRPSRTIT